MPRPGEKGSPEPSEAMGLPSQIPRVDSPKGKSMKKYLVGVLYYGSKDDEHDACMKKLERHPRILNLAEVKGCPYIDIGRATLAEYALALEDCEGLLFIDHDILFDSTSVDQILESCDETRAVVGAAYSMRSAGSKMIGAIDVHACGDRPIVFFDGGGVYPALYLGMGFTAIHRTALELIAAHAESVRARRHALIGQLEEQLENANYAARDRGRELLAELSRELQDPLPTLSNGVTKTSIRPFFSLLQREGAYYGEDVSFCLRAKDAGVGVFMDSRVRVAHKGAYAYELEDCGFVVPILKRLDGVITGTPNAQPSPASPHTEVRAAIEASAGKTTETLLGMTPALPSEPKPQTPNLTPSSLGASP